MNTTAAEANLSANPDVGIHHPLSEYAKKLESPLRQRYLEKISANRNRSRSHCMRIF